MKLIATIMMILALSIALDRNKARRKVIDTKAELKATQDSLRRLQELHRDHIGQCGFIHRSVAMKNGYQKTMK